MPQLINNSAVLRTAFSSNTLTGNCSIAHPVQQPGRYVVFVWRQERCVASGALEVSDSGGENQANLDCSALESIGRTQPLSTPSQDCALRKGGHLLLFSSQGDGAYYATLNDRTGQKQLWDSRTLVAGDLYSLLALVPGIYSITNQLAGKNASMEVEFHPSPAEITGRIDKNPVYVKCSAGGFEPAEWRTSGAQPVVFAVGLPSIISTALQKSTAEPRSKEQRLAYEHQRLLEALGRLKKPGVKA